MEETSLLSEAETARYREQGYLALDGICPQDEVGYIRATLMDMFENRTGYNEGAQYDFISRDDPSRPARFPSLHDPRHYAPDLLKTTYHARTLAMARQLLGPDAALYGEHALLAGRGRARDALAPGRGLPLARLRLQGAEHLAGAAAGHAGERLHAVHPRSNKWDVLEHRSPGGDKHLHPLECCGDFARDLAVAEPLAPGGCTVHDARTLHHTGANTSDAPRLAYILIYNTPPVYKPGRREFPWLEGRWTDSQTRKKEWHRRGGLAVDLVRRLPAIRLTSPRWLAWATIRAVNKVWPR